MRRILVSSLISVALGTGAVFAADLPPPAPQTYYKVPPPAPVANWTGCYVNGGGGYGLMTMSQFGETLPGGVPVTPFSVDTGGQGWFGVAGGGCDYQFHVWNWDLVIGAFGDYDFAMNVRGTNGLVLGNVQENAAWAGGARVGVVVAPNVLVYSTGGYSGTHINQINIGSAAGVGGFFNTPAQNLNGWFVGGGTETALSWVMPGLFLRTEYRYASYPAADFPIVLTGTGAATGTGLRTTLYTQTIFTQLVYRFNFGNMLAFGH
jgi:outer membrane immunogenic protein